MRCLGGNSFQVFFKYITYKYTTYFLRYCRIFLFFDLPIEKKRRPTERKLRFLSQLGPPLAGGPRRASLYIILNDIEINYIEINYIELNYTELNYIEIKISSIITFQVVVV